MPGIPWFRKSELKDIAISVGVLSFVFSYPEILSSPAYILIAMLSVGIAFIGHELSHRYVARRLGYWSEYRMWNQGILLALLMAVGTGGGLVFAAPGAVVFSSYWASASPSKRDIGRIGISGVLFNISAMFLMISLSLAFSSPFFGLAGFVNGWLAIFNLIPFGPLDGQKVLSWNRAAWACALALAVSGTAYLVIF
jgi:Zn-dependent protease